MNKALPYIIDAVLIVILIMHFADGGQNYGLAIMVLTEIIMLKAGEIPKKPLGRIAIYSVGITTLSVGGTLWVTDILRSGTSNAWIILIAVFWLLALGLFILSIQKSSNP